MFEYVAARQDSESTDPGPQNGFLRVFPKGVVKTHGPNLIQHAVHAQVVAEFWAVQEPDFNFVLS